MPSVRLTMAQALVRFLASQYVERDGSEQRFFAGCWGIFGHGNVAGIGQALRESAGLLTYHQAKNEQGMVHAAVGFARMRDRLQTFACTSSIGPGATNMLTGAAVATVNRIPVLLLPGDVFASRIPDPVLQQLEVPSRGDVSVNDAFQPLSRYWDRVARPEQIVPAALAAMRVLTSPAETGAVTLCLPQDVQTEAFDVPEEFLAKRVWHIERRLPDAAALERARDVIASAKRPLIVAGGGVIYSGASVALAMWAQASGIPVAETQAGKGSLPYDHPAAAGAIGVTGTSAANALAKEADVVIGIGTRWSDFTTMSKSIFQAPEVRFVNVNVAEPDAHKHAGLALVGDARATIAALATAPYRVPDAYRAEAQRLARDWDREVERLYTLGHTPLPAQSEVIGTVNAVSAPEDVVVCAAGSMPGDLHKLWRTRDPKGYHVEYGYSTMGYEIAGGLGVRIAAPERDVFVLVGDGSYLMLAQELVTAVQEAVKLIVVIVDNHGFSSIGALSRSVGGEGFGTHYRYRTADGIGLDREGPQGDVLPIDLAQNAESLGVPAIRVRTIAELREALVAAKNGTTSAAVVIEVDRYEGVPSFGSWWDVAVAEIAGDDEVTEARKRYDAARKAQRSYLRTGG
ncbi:MAG TPA: 3D-(3,5/4)-trihydroxycyclohexane-1,2-dione acylhydrolase (decyclizing) [Candidatus Limnocylindria bacterium]|nr:3D-(3,5/4)-trihydroxycyclohexane-1,2-dione acylhydrolase (decyclizing) [Candidatus Limnocylindria bacterium]